MFNRLVLTVFTMLFGGIGIGVYNSIATLELGNVAGDQFADSDKACLISNSTFMLFSVGYSVIALVLFFITLGIWWVPLKKIVFAVKHFDSEVQKAINDKYTARITDGNPTRFE